MATTTGTISASPSDVVAMILAIRGWPLATHQSEKGFLVSVCPTVVPVGQMKADTMVTALWLTG